MKKRAMVIAELLSVLAIFNIIVWWIQFNRQETFWVGYILATLAIVEFFAGVFVSYAHSSIKSRFFNFPLFYTMYAGGVLLMAFGVIFIVFNTIPLKTSLLISAILLIINLMLLIGTDVARQEMTGVEKNAKMKSFYIGSLEQTVRGMIVPGMDAALKKEMERLAEDIHYSDPMSSPALTSLESEIRDECEQLQDRIGEPAAALDACKKLRKLVQARNEKCALLK